MLHCFEISSISIKNFGLRSKSPVFQIKYFEILVFSYIEFGIPSISKLWYFD